MPKLPAMTSRDIIKLLEKEGFVLDRIKGSHHIYYHPESKPRALIPFHKKDLPKGTLLEILKQAGLSREAIQKLK